MATAKPEMIRLWATRDKCTQCKHKFNKPFLLPVEKPVRGAFQPNINKDVLFHMSDTHGIPADVFIAWIAGSIYGQELGDFGIKADQELSGLYKAE